MTPTDELRAELTRRGVEFQKCDTTEGCFTLWRANGIDAGFDDMERWEQPHLLVVGFTPEQAIAATLDAGTCYYSPDDVGFTWWDENDVEHCEEYSASDECCSASCDKCGYTMMVGDDGWFDGWDEITEWWEDDGSYHKGHVLKPRFKHCPNCGRKVVDE